MRCAGASVGLARVSSGRRRNAIARLSAELALEAGDGGRGLCEYGCDRYLLVVRATMRW
jgi:hypothetical protein